MGRHDRPEHTAPPELFYDDVEAVKYTENTRIIGIQTQLTERALELLALPEDGTPRLLLDLGCGSGLSGEVLTDKGHTWIGMDISPSMLEIAVEREVEGDVNLVDLGQGVPIRSGTVDGIISISAIQWLCNADTRAHDPRKRLKRFFETLYRCLARGGRAVLQFYPESTDQASLITAAAMKVGFSGGLVVDFPNSTRAKKHFLVLMVGGGPSAVPRGLDGEGDDEAMADGAGGWHEGGEGVGPRGEVEVGRRRGRGGGPRGSAGGRGTSGRGAQARDWVLRKKQQQRTRGIAAVRPDTKYTGRKRKDRF